METTRVDICYRPLRIAWAIQSDDRESFRRAVRLSHTLWGGCFNPIVLVDRTDEAKSVVELFRADLIWPIGDSTTVQEFPKQFPHLITPFLPELLYLKDSSGPTRAHILDIHNMLVHSRHTPDWKAIEAQGVRTIVWSDDDPLTDTFLMQHGAYPNASEIGIDYADILSRATMAINIDLDKNLPIKTETYDHASIRYLTRHGIHRHYSIRPSWDYPGFFVGDANDIVDLTRFWNLRAADIRLHFIDPVHISRYGGAISKISGQLRADLSHLDDHRKNIAVWSRVDKLDDALKLFPGGGLSACQVSDDIWNGGAVRPPMMILGEASSLGVFDSNNTRTKVSFSLSDKPFSNDSWFYTQHLVASVSLSSGDEQLTFRPPYLPELNEFFGWTMHFDRDDIRIEPERMGIIIDAADHDSFLFALPASQLVEKVFGMIGMRAKLSGGGLIARQLISRLGGVDGARVFKIPGVRRLLKNYGPTHSFTQKAALSSIGRTDPANPQAKFKDHERLFIEPRDNNTKLTPPMVFTYLVDKGLLRIGAELICPTCSLPSWYALDVLKQRNVCELCGSEYDATRQLIDGKYHYRRSGALGLEKNSQGAIPVALTLQQLHINLGGLRHQAMYAPSYDLEPNAGVTLPRCEIDFIWIIPDCYPDPTQIILGECKDEGYRIDRADVDHLRSIADALPSNRFEPFILFAKLSPFSAEEIALAKSLNGPYQSRVILLTARELEPYHIYERTAKETGITSYGGSPEELALVTNRIYFQTQIEEPAAASQRPGDGNAG
jgi:hypothetical protein